MSSTSLCRFTAVQEIPSGIPLKISPVIPPGISPEIPSSMSENIPWEISSGIAACIQKMQKCIFPRIPLGISPDITRQHFSNPANTRLFMMLQRILKWRRYAHTLHVVKWKYMYAHVLHFTTLYDFVFAGNGSILSILYDFVNKISQRLPLRILSKDFYI